MMQESERFSSKKCPVGCQAHHYKHGLVDVIGMSGLAREIKYTSLNEDTMVPSTYVEMVHVTELREENLLKALGLNENATRSEIEELIPEFYVRFDK